VQPAKPFALVQSGNKCLRPGCGADSEQRWRNDDVTQQSNDYRPLGTRPRNPLHRDRTAGRQLSVATEEPYFDKNGERRERTEWHRVVVVAKLALVCQEHLKKGRQIYVEGRLHTSEFETKVTGRKLRLTEIAASHVQLLGTPVGEPTEVRGANEAIESAETDNPL
jgi:single stranded DNA-binding protein